MNRARLPLFATGMTFVMALAALGGERLHVLTTIPPVHCFTLNVAGELASVQSLIPSGASAHDFHLTRRERRLVDAAGLIVLNGLGMESWLDRALKSGPARTTVEASAGLNARLIAGNPHIWLDPLLAAHMVTNILTALQSADPANAAAYATNAAAYVAKLHSLDAEIRSTLAGLTNRAIVTAHDAFPYFARRYDLNIVGTLEEVADVDPTPGHLTALRRAIERHGAKVLFVDAHHSNRRAKQLARDFKVTVGVLDTLEASPLTPSAYEDGMRRNLRALQQTMK